jgi:hypothetical protein
MTLTMSPHLTESQLRTLLAEIGRVVDGSGFGSVEVVIEKGRVRRIKTTVETWLEPRPQTAAGVGGESPR